MRCFSVFLLFIALNSSFVWGQTAFVGGRVYDRENNESLPGSHVLYGDHKGLISDKDGNYLIGLAPGKWEITFQYVGFTPEKIEIDLVLGDTLVVNVGLVPTINQVEQVVVSANRAEQKLSDLTVSLSLIKPYFINQNHITNAQELLNKTPGIEVLDGQASIRGGSGFSYGAGSRVMVLIDGLPVIAADAGNIKWQFLPLENISQVEIIKGASSVIYGSSALNGIINFRTKEPGDKPITRLVTEAGIYDHPSREAWKWWDKPRMFSNASFSHLQKSGNTDISIESSLLYNNGYRSNNDEKLGRFNFGVTHHSKKLEGLQYGVNLNSGLTEKTDFILWKDAYTGALIQDESTINVLRGSFLAIDPFIIYRRGKRSNHDLKMRFQSSTNRFPNSSQTNSDASTLYMEYQYKHSINRSMDLFLGLTENFSGVRSNFYGNHTILNSALFGQFESSIRSRLKFITGIRAEQYFQDGESEKLIPIFRSGLNYRLTNLTFLRASFGQGYRYPSIAEKYASTSLGSIRIYPNLEIRPESGWNAEIGLKQGFLADLLNGMVDLAVFYTQNRDMIEYVFGLYEDPANQTFDFGFRSANIENSKVYGAELEFSMNYSTGKLNNLISGGYTYLHPVEILNSDKFLKYRRKHALNLGWNGSINDFQLGLMVYAKSKILEIDNVFVNEFSRETILPGFYDYWTGHQKGYILADISLGYQVSSGVNISLTVKNILNREYMGRPGDIMPQRNFSLRVSSLL